MEQDCQREESLFEAALDLSDPAERRAFLDKACGQDKALRERIERLLSLAKRADDLFTKCVPALEAAANEADAGLVASAAQSTLNAEPQQPDYIGAFKLLEKLGEGGCGVVYMAEQEQPIRRRVALKIIKLGMDTKSVMARFEAERQALAMMDHPNIARVFDAGATEKGRPYFVMELIQGVKITEYCDQRELGLKQRLELFVQICQAIQHAHQKGIVHRDIKPSNILVTTVDGEPVPKVIDFGIAKAIRHQFTDETLLTAHGNLIGTPDYMSPEQVSLDAVDVDTRSDIYSLGVLLYELLTGKTPFDTKELLKISFDQMRHTLLQHEPRSPSAKVAALALREQTQTASQRQTQPPRLVSQLRGDLDRIVMKCLEKDRTRRYQTAYGLAMDVQRYLNNEPVLAQTQSRWYLFQKMVNRNRLAFVAGAAVAATLIAGTTVSTWLYLGQRDAQHRADTEKLELEASRRQAEQQHKAQVREQIAHADSLLSAKNFAAADEIVTNIQFEEPSKEAAAVLRQLGALHAYRSNWRESAARHAALVKVDQLDGDNAIYDYMALACALVKAGDLNTYEHFRLEAVARFARTNFLAADRMLDTALVLPANQQLMEELAPHAEFLEHKLPPGDSIPNSLDASHILALSLFEYRQGHFARAADLSRRCLGSSVYVASRNAAADAILAMACWQLNQKEEALAALNLGTKISEGKFTAPATLRTGFEGFWFESEFARALLREAEKPFVEADGSMVSISIAEPNTEQAAMFRILGEWHGTREEWAEALQRFQSCLHADQRDTTEHMAQDYLNGAIACLETRSDGNYLRLRDDACSRFKALNKANAECLLKICLLEPVDGKTVAVLEPFAAALVPAVAGGRGSSSATNSPDALSSLLLGLFDYRRGDYSKAADWARHGLDAPRKTEPNRAAEYVILAMSLRQLGNNLEAELALQQAENRIQKDFSLDSNMAHWRDCLLARLLFQEAKGLMP